MKALKTLAVSVATTATLVSVYASPLPAKTKPLPTKVVSVESVKKGGSLYPSRPARYTLAIVKAVLTKEDDLTEANVRATLEQIVNDTRRKMNPDAITVFLYQSKAHLDGGNAPIGKANWWPRGGSLSEKNARNVENKATHVLGIDVTLPRTVEDPSATYVVRRLPEPVRRTIYAELQGAVDRADVEAYNRSDLNSDQQYELGERLARKYRDRVRKRYGLTENEVKHIIIEGSLKQWPLPTWPSK